MKLRQLNGAIRAGKKTRIYVNVGGAARLHVVVEKTDLLDQLALAFPDGGDTNLELTPDGTLTRVGDPGQDDWTPPMRSNDG